MHSLNNTLFIERRFFKMLITINLKYFIRIILSYVVKKNNILFHAY
jgi:hypothetical protein